MRLCDAFSVPVVTIVDTEGFVPSVTDDVAGGIREAARLAATYADATTAKVAVLAGKAVALCTPLWLLRPAHCCDRLHRQRTGAQRRCQRAV